MNKLCYGDNLDILREYIDDESIDLIYLDPPFNSKRAYNIIFRDSEGKYPPSQIDAFEDTWHWSDEDELILDELSKPKYPPEVIGTLRAFKEFLDETDLMAYLTMMSIRLLELKRVLKDNGSIYLHCDPTASHFLKILMDRIFRIKNFRNEIIWHYRKWPTGKYQFQRNHDIILFYTKNDVDINKNKHIFNQLYMERTESTLKRFGTSKIKSGYTENGVRVPSITLDEDSEGVRMDDVWDIGRVPPIKQLFPTQKPLPLLERIINASSNENDVVLDPFCGCGTALVAAEKLKRQWIGIDITILAFNLIAKRLTESFQTISFEEIGIPKDKASAVKLASTAQGKKQFEKWFVTALGGQPYKWTGGGDKGIDGFLYFKDIQGKSHKVVISVKGGHYNRVNVDELRGVVEKNDYAMGILLALNEPTEGMLSAAAAAGRYHMPMTSKSYPKIQVFTVKQLFEGLKPDLPDTSGTLRNSDKITPDDDSPSLLD